MSRTRSMVLAAGCGALALALSACGSSSSGAAAKSTSAGTGSAAAAPKGDPIVVGSICSCTGAQSAVLAHVRDGNEAWAKAVNAKGGINGHPVKMVVVDDAGEPAKGLKAAKELVEQDKVQAIVGTVSLTTAVWADYVSGKGVPVVGGLPGESPFASNPDFFPSGSSLPIVTFGQMSLAKQAGKHTFGLLYCAESPICAQLDPIVKGLTSVVGLQYTSGKVAGTAPNFTAPCLAMKDAGVDALYVAHNSTVVDRLITACAQQNYKPLNSASITTIGLDSLKNPSFEGSAVASPNALFTDTSITAVKTFNDAIKMYAPDVLGTPGFNSQLLFAWTGGKLFEKAAAAANLGPTSTPADVQRGLYALKDETLDGLAPPLNFVQGKPSFPSCYFALAIKGQEFVASDGGKPTCLTTEQLTSVGAALKG